MTFDGCIERILRLVSFYFISNILNLYLSTDFVVVVFFIIDFLKEGSSFVCSFIVLVQSEC